MFPSLASHITTNHADAVKMFSCGDTVHAFQTAIPFYAVHRAGLCCATGCNYSLPFLILYN